MQPPRDDRQDSLKDPLHPAPGAAGPTRAKLAWKLCRGVTIFSLLAFATVYVGQMGWQLYQEYQALQLEQRGDRLSRYIGYVEINPTPNLAAPPDNWVQQDGKETLLWSGYKPGVGHGWFRLASLPVDQSRLTGLIGRDTLRAIDRPIVEIGGGKCWSRIPFDAEVLGYELAGQPVAVPLVVLESVLVVNDTLQGQGAMLTLSSADRRRPVYELFDPRHEQGRLMLGHSGYFIDEKPVLYDRQTESLWMSTEDGLTAIAGPLQGSVLRRLAKLDRRLWTDWLKQNPETRLIVGADRSEPARTD